MEHAPHPEGHSATEPSRVGGSRVPYDLVRAMLAALVAKAGGAVYITEDAMRDDLYIIQADPASDGYPSWLLQTGDD